MLISGKVMLSQYVKYFSSIKYQFYHIFSSLNIVLVEVTALMCRINNKNNNTYWFSGPS